MYASEFSQLDLIETSKMPICGEPYIFEVVVVGLVPLRKKKNRTYDNNLAFSYGENMGNSHGGH